MFLFQLFAITQKSYPVQSNCRQGSAVTRLVHWNFKLNFKIDFCTDFKQTTQK